MKRWIGVTPQGQAVRDTVTDAPPAQDGIVFVEVGLDAPVSTSTHYWSGVDWALQGLSPGEHYAFDYAARQWVDPRTLRDLKDARWAAIKTSRDVAEFGAFVYNGMEFDGDLNAQRRLSSYISISKSAIAAGQPFSADFTLADNTLVTLTAQDFVGIELAKVQAVVAAFAHATGKRGLIEAAATAEAVAAVGW